MTVSLVTRPASLSFAIALTVLRAAIALPATALRHPGRTLVVRRGTGQVTIR